MQKKMAFFSDDFGLRSPVIFRNHFRQKKVYLYRGTRPWSLKTIDLRIPTMPGRNTSGFHRPGRHCLLQARNAVRCSASRVKGELHLALRAACQADFRTPHLVRSTFLRIPRMSASNGFICYLACRSLPEAGYGSGSSCSKGVRFFSDTLREPTDASGYRFILPKFFSLMIIISTIDRIVSCTSPHQIVCLVRV